MIQILVNSEKGVSVNWRKISKYPSTICQDPSVRQTFPLMVALRIGREHH